MRDRHEGFIRVLNERRRALDIPDSVDQPVAVHLQHPGDGAQLFHAGPRRAAAQDIVDEGSVDAGHLGDMRGAEAELLGPCPETVGKGMMLGHVFLNRLWIKKDKTGLNGWRQANRNK